MRYKQILTILTYYGDTAPTDVTFTDGDIWFDSYNLRFNVRHQGLDLPRSSRRR